MGDVVSSFTDDVLGFDPNGGGIYGAGRDVLGDTIADDVLGMDPNGGGLIKAYNVIGPAALAYFGGGALMNSLSGTELGSMLSNVGSSISDAFNSTFGTAGGTMTPDMVQGAMDAYESAGYAASDAAKMIADATGNSVDSVWAAYNGDLAALKASGTGLSSIVQNLGSLGSQGLSAAKSLMTAAGVNPQTVSGLGNLLGIGAGVYGTMSQKELADKQEQLAKWMVENADPYRQYRKEQEIPFMQQMIERAPGQFNKAEQIGQQAATSLGDMFYQDRMKQSYTNPLAVYNTPEMQALNAQFMNSIQRRDAAAGRNSQYGARAVEAQNNFLTNTLPAYRTGLGQGQQTATQQGSALGNLFNQQGNYANTLATLGMPNEATAGAGTQAAGSVMSGANAMDAFSYSPLFQSLGYSVPGASTATTTK